jgi:polyphosphate kinase 2 (PPK2 family)
MGKKSKASKAKPGAEKPGAAVPKEAMSRKDYARAMKKLHVELVKLQEWVKHQGLKVCIVFEGRDGAGKGGTIKAITERVSPRVFRVVALTAPTEREKSQMYVQRYLPYLPAAGEIVIFDRSWYNRAGVERVMGFCTEEEADVIPENSRRVREVDRHSGIILLKYWLEVSPTSRRADSRSASTTGARSGSSRRWTSSPTVAGMTTRGRATRCSPRPILHGRRGSSRDPTTSSGRGSTSSVTC